MKASQLSEVILRFSFFGLVAITILIGIIGIKFLAIPLLISGIHFYIFHSIVDHLESRGVPRSATILLIFGFLISFAYWIVGFYLPGLFESAQPIIADWSQKMDDPNFQLIDFNKLPILSKNPELWKKTEDMVRKVMDNANIPYIEVPDEAAFYGPKIDIQIYSAIGREFTLATNQVDFGQPLRFGLTYTDRDNQPKMPLVIHRAPLGTHERFIGFLLEHYACLLYTSPSPRD